MIAVDEIIYDLLREQTDNIKSNPEVLDLIFEGKPKEKIEQIKQFLLTQKIRIVMHHPRDAQDFPCYSIVLEGSTESEQVIGAADYDEIPISNMEDGWIGSDSDIFRTNVYLPTDVEQMYSAVEVKDGRRSCHMVAKQGTSVGKGIWIDFQNSVLEGGYVSLTDINELVIWIKSNRLGTFLEFGFGEEAHREKTFNIALTERKVWERVEISLDGIANRDRDKVRYMSFKIIDDSERTDIFIDALRGKKTYGTTINETLLDNRYRIETWSENADLTLSLYTILLWNMLKYRDYLENSWGLLEQRIEGGDIMPQPEYYPAFMYVRALMFSCKTIETVPRESDLVAYQIRLGKQDWGN
jgi:hypothetical protein